VQACSTQLADSADSEIAANVKYYFGFKNLKRVEKRQYIMCR
jgi:hypothetical protein